MQTLKIDTVEDWLNTVAFSHSNSKNTRTNYKLIFGKFLNFIGKTADQLVNEYENTNDRTFKRTYGSYLKAWITQLQKADYAPRTISGHINIVKSFFKYNDLPLSFIPCGNGMVTFHNRDITKEEIVQILKLSDFREKAFYSLIAQTGLRPETLTKLKIGDLEKILDSDTPTPCLITVRQEATKGAYQGYFTFAPEESIKHLKEYLQTRKTPLNKDSLLFCMYNDESKPISPGVFSHLFRRVVMRLQKDNILSFETKRKDIEVKTKEDVLLRRHISRNELRLYNLRKFFRKYAGQAGADFVNFWMGHTSALGVDLHYFSRDVEFHRKVFIEKALPFLRIETHTPSETEKQIEELRKENAELRSRLENIERNRDNLAALLQRVTELEKKLNAPPS